MVLLIHGGAFAGGDASMEAGYAQTLASQGIAAASVNYRLSGEAPYPAGAQDVKAAVRWLRANAAQYGLDPNNIGAWGQSAGGWMANMLGATGDQQTIFDDPALGNADQSSTRPTRPRLRISPATSRARRPCPAGTWRTATPTAWCPAARARNWLTP